MDAEWDMYEKVRSTWPRLDRWRERIRSDFRPTAGSELADARVVITRALSEDLRYGPDITTMATVPTL